MHAPARPGELERSILNIDRAAGLLGWKPSLSLEQGLTQTFDYFQQQKKTPIKKA